MTVQHRYLPVPAGEDCPGRAAGWMTDSEWVARQVAVMPAAWRETLTSEWRGAWAPFEGKRRAANLAVLEAVGELRDAQRAGLRPDASDDEIRSRARTFARHYETGIKARECVEAEAWALSNLNRHGMWDFWPGWKPGKPGQQDPRKTRAASFARLCCERWWRRVLRRVFARTVEACSIGLGLVNKARQCYVSNLSAARRRQQLARNAASMEATELENEYGQRMKLSELAAKSNANKAVRRAELMTRISGFDVIARDLGHEATFVTVTCPSRMHKWTDTDRGVMPNPRHDGTTPGQAQKYLSGQWAKARAALHRRGVDLYGFRVAEPHHDGCPHWHLLLFHPVGQVEQLRDVFARYFLKNDSPTERGADQHRVKFERIDRTKGSAAAYLAKYISKNVDGYKVGTDLYGAPAIESAQRVEAWAATWGIRQFQQLGGAPVTVWRELRRINPEELPADLLPDSLRDSLSAVNVGQVGGLWAEGWAAYLRAQGGPCVKRAAMRIRLLRQETGEVNRYQEVKPADVIGVEASGRAWHKPAHMIARLGHLAPLVPRPAAARIESERAQWRVVRAGDSLPSGEAGRPWTRVNNCTRTAIVTPSVMRDSVLVQRGKTGRYRGFLNAGSNGPSGVAAKVRVD